MRKTRITAALTALLMAAIATGCGSTVTRTVARAAPSFPAPRGFSNNCHIYNQEIKRQPGISNPYAVLAKAYQYCDGNVVWQRMRSYLWEKWVSDGKYHPVILGSVVDGSGAGQLSLGSDPINTTAAKDCASQDARRYHLEITSVINTGNASAPTYVHNDTNYPASDVSLNCLVTGEVTINPNPGVSSP